MRDLLQKALKEITLLNREQQNKVDSKEDYYQIIVNDIPTFIREKFSKGNEYSISGGTGQGNLAEVMWNVIGLPSITSKATQGYYVAILYRKDGDGFYISLNQSWKDIRITVNKERPVKESRFIAKKNAELIRELITSKGVDLTNYLTDINLGEELGNTAQGYEHGNIISKYYTSEDLPTDSTFEKDLLAFLNIYKVISSILSYAEYKNMTNDNATIDFSNEKEKSTTNKPGILSYYYQNKDDDFHLESSPLAGSTYKDNSNDKMNSKKAKGRQTNQEGNRKRENQKELGEVGERLARDYMIKKIEELAQPRLQKELIEHVTLVSEVNEMAGFDILGFDISTLGNDNPKEVYYEVKTTSSSNSNYPFHISRNELANIIEHKDKVKIMRVYNVKEGATPHCIIIDGFEKYHSIEELLHDKFNHTVTNVKITGWKME